MAEGQSKSIEFAQAALREAYAEGFNAGVDSVQGDYVLIPKQDFSNWLSQLVRVIKEIPMLEESEEEPQGAAPPPPSPTAVAPRPRKPLGRRPATARAAAVPAPAPVPAPQAADPEDIHVHTAPVMLTPEDEQNLNQMVERMAIRSGAPVNWPADR